MTQGCLADLLKDGDFKSETKRIFIEMYCILNELGWNGHVDFSVRRKATMIDAGRLIEMYEEAAKGM